jgi:membrane-bound metal-dependent hydrolase YbcI (DUF457 family)
LARKKLKEYLKKEFRIKRASMYLRRCRELGHTLVWIIWVWMIVKRKTKKKMKRKQKLKIK